MAITDDAIAKAALRAELAMHTGTQTWFRHWTGCFTYTEGVQYLAKTAGAYWLIDLVPRVADIAVAGAYTSRRYR